MYTEEVPIYTNQIITQRRYIPIYVPINQLHRGGKTVYTEEVSTYNNQSITQRRYDSVY